MLQSGLDQLRRGRDVVVDGADSALDVVLHSGFFANAVPLRNSRGEIVKWYGAPPDRISVTYLGGDHFSGLDADSSVLSRMGISGSTLFLANAE